MKLIATWLCVSLFVTAASFSLPGQTADDAVTPKHEIELFDGKSLAGWTFVSARTNAPAAAIWSVTNGVLLCQGKPNGYARTWTVYRDYQLHAEWRWPSGS